MSGGGTWYICDKCKTPWDPEEEYGGPCEIVIKGHREHILNLSGAAGGFCPVTGISAEWKSEDEYIATHHNP